MTELESKTSQFLSQEVVRLRELTENLAWIVCDCRGHFQWPNHSEAAEAYPILLARSARTGEPPMSPPDPAAFPGRRDYQELKQRIEELEAELAKVRREAVEANDLAAYLEQQLGGAG